MSSNYTIRAALSQGRQISTASSGCAFADENSFGPSVTKQCRTFDFTLLFEQAFLSLVPSIILVLGSVIRLIGIARHDVKTLKSRWHVSKLV
jgi:ATP-binding cassette subfamily C (CFTR/MRP) protein 1